MIAGPRTHRALEPRALLDHDPPLDPGVDQLAVDAALDVLEHQAVRLEHVLELPGVLPPAASRCATRPACRRRSARWIASVISSSPRPEGSIALAASKIAGRTCRRRPGRGRWAGPSASRPGARRARRRARRPRSARVGDLGEQDQRVGLGGAEGVDEVADPVAQQVVAEVHHERRVAEELLGGEHRVGEAQRLGLGDVGDRGAEARSRRRPPRGSRPRSRARSRSRSR